MTEAWARLQGSPWLGLVVGAQRWGFSWGAQAGYRFPRQELKRDFAARVAQKKRGRSSRSPAQAGRGPAGSLGPNSSSELSASRGFLKSVVRFKSNGIT